MGPAPATRDHLERPVTDEVHVWRIRFAEVSAIRDRLAGYLDEEERARAARFATGALRERAVLGRGALRAILARYLGIAPAHVPLTGRPCTSCGGGHGKPALAPPLDALGFNVAHTSDSLVVAVAQGREIGVDLEPRSAGARLEECAGAWLSPREEEQLAGLPASERPAGLVRLWTLKEAYLKARGTGLNEDPRAVSVELGEPPVVRVAPGDREPAEWLLLPVDAGDEDVVSVAVARGQVEPWSPQVVVRSLGAGART
jgi:4'-phosphopantetheinyl transferase